MGLRFQRSLTLLKGVKLNVSKSGGSFTLGKKGATINIGKDGITGTVGVPGSGLSYREKLTGRKGNSLVKTLVWVAIIAVLILSASGYSLEDLTRNVLATLPPK